MSWEGLVHLRKGCILITIFQVYSGIVYGLRGMGVYHRSKSGKGIPKWLKTQSIIAEEININEPPKPTALISGQYPLFLGV